MHGKSLIYAILPLAFDKMKGREAPSLRSGLSRQISLLWEVVGEESRCFRVLRADIFPCTSCFILEIFIPKCQSILTGVAKDSIGVTHLLHAVQWRRSNSSINVACTTSQPGP